MEGIVLYFQKLWALIFLLNNSLFVCISSALLWLSKQPRSTVKMSSQPFLEIIARRRTCYQLGAQSPISHARIQKIIEDVLLNVPSAFNSQTVRIILLVKEEHRKLWDIAAEVLKGVVPEDAFAATEKKLKGFRAAFGTVGLGIINICFTLAYYLGPGSFFRSSPHHPRLSGEICPLC